MLKFAMSGKIPLINNLFFLMREDGHIFTFDYETFKWHDVSDEYMYDGTWDLFETSQQFDHAMVDDYELISKMYHKNVLHYFETHPSFKWGEALNFYKKDELLRAKDEYGNEYSLEIPYMKVSEEKLIDDSWKRFYRLDVLFEVGKFREIIRIYRLDLYKDKEGNLRAFSKDGKEYRVSKKTGYVNEVLDTKGVDSSYKAVSENFLVKFCEKDHPELFITWFDLQNMRELDKYLFTNKKELKEKYDITLGDDIRYFNSGWGDIYAKDSNNNEFHVLPDSLVPVEKKSVKTNEWKEINHFNALEYARFYKQRKKELENEDEIILALDLKLYENNDGEIIGKSEKGVWYVLDGEGDFIKVTHEMNKNGLDMTPNSVDISEVLYIQGQRMAEAYFENYLLHTYNALSEEEKEDVGDIFNLFINSKKDKGLDIYLKDNNENEYVCKKDGFKKVPKGTIKKSFEKVSIQNFKIYYQLFLMDEEE